MEQQPSREIRFDILERLLEKEEKISGNITTIRERNKEAPLNLFSLNLHLWKNEQEVQQDLQDALEIQAALLEDFNNIYFRKRNLPAYKTAKGIPDLLSEWIQIAKENINATGREPLIRFAQNKLDDFEAFQEKSCDDSFTDIITSLKTKIQLWKSQIDFSQQRLAIYQTKFRQFQGLENLIRRLQAILRYYQTEREENKYIEYFHNLRSTYLDVREKLKMKEHELAETQRRFPPPPYHAIQNLHAEINDLKTKIAELKTIIQKYKDYFELRSKITEIDLYPQITQTLQAIRELEALP